MLERRSFLISCGCVAAGLAATVAGDAVAGDLDASATVLPLRPQETNETAAVAWRIQGWDAPESGDDADGLIWIGIGRSWRAAWR